MQEDAQQQNITFEDLGLKQEILQSIKEAGFSVPSPIQKAAIPFVLDGRDMVAQAHTGTGKTAAFGLPALNNIDKNSGVELLVITPTRELATQVSDELYKYGRNIGIKTVTVYGGSSYNRQLDLIGRGANVVVATPGRLLDILKRGLIKNFIPKMVVLDEADEMLDMGFLDDINEIFSYLPTTRQTLLFSATMPKPIKILAEKILNNPEFVSITKGETTNTDIAQEYYVIEESERDDAIIRLMHSENAQKSIVFCRTKSEVDRLSNVLSGAGYLSGGLHGDMEQKQRESVIKTFKSGNTRVLVATDVAARGIHVDNITHVFNYHIPFDPESYVHRIGRTGRAGLKGKAITLLTPLEFKELQRIKSIVGTTMTHAFVPSKNDLKKSNLESLVQKIEDQYIYDEAHKVIDMLKEDIDEETIIYKLVSMILDKQNIQGPNHIGLSAERLNAILDRINSRDPRRSRSSSHRRRSDSRGGNRGDSRGPRSDSRGDLRNDSRTPRSDSRGSRDANRPDSRNDSRGGSRADSRNRDKTQDRGDRGQKPSHSPRDKKR